MTKITPNNFINVTIMDPYVGKQNVLVNTNNVNFIASELTKNKNKKTVIQFNNSDHLLVDGNLDSISKKLNILA